MQKDCCGSGARLKIKTKDNQKDQTHYLHFIQNNSKNILDNLCYADPTCSTWIYMPRYVIAPRNFPASLTFP